ncbi:MAG TPA: hypothetical protein VGN34_08950, partial [Ktedonobacteraceae bacterium]
MVSLMILFFFFFPHLFSNIWWLCLDLHYKHKQGLKHTMYQHTSHILLCGWILLLALASMLLPAINKWADSEILISLSGLLCFVIGLWDLHAVILHQYDPERLPLRTRTLGRIGWIAPPFTCTFGIIYPSYGIFLVIEAVFHVRINPSLISWGASSIMVLSVLSTIVMYNAWRDVALFKAAQKLQSMPEGFAKEILSTILEAANEKHMWKRLFFWQAYNFLIGLWPSCLLILLLVLYKFGYISLSFLASGWTVIGFLAIVQAFGRMQ